MLADSVNGYIERKKHYENLDRVPPAPIIHHHNLPNPFGGSSHYA